MQYKNLIITLCLFWIFDSSAFNLDQKFRATGSSLLSDEDQKSVESIMNVRYESFKEKNADKLVGLFSENSNFVNQSGRLYWGRNANLKRHKKVFSTEYGEHLLAKIPVESKLLKWCAYGQPTKMVTIVTEYQFKNHQSDLKIPQYDPMKPTKGIFTTVLFKTNNSESVNGWEIVSMQNTPTLPSQHNE